MIAKAFLRATISFLVRYLLQLGRYSFLFHRSISYLKWELNYLKLTLTSGY